MPGLFSDLPLWVTMPVFLLVFLAGSWAIVLLLRPWVHRMADGHPEWDRVLGYAMASYGVLFGITLALIVVSAYQNYDDVRTVVLHEASTLGVVYRDFSGYPAPLSGQLQDLLRNYTQHIVSVDFVQQGHGIIPTEGIAEVDRIQQLLFNYEPASTGQAVLHNQTIERFNDFVLARRERLTETSLALPGLLWVLLIIGAALNAVLIALVEVKNVRVHLIMSGIIALFVGLVIFVTATMDHPYSGVVSVTPEAFQVLLDGLMASG